MDLSPSTWTGTIIGGVAGNLVFACAVVALKKFRGQLERAHPLARQAVWVLLFGLYTVGNFLFLSMLPLWVRAYLLLTGLVFCIVVWWELRQFWRLGVVGADSTIRGGINFSRSLRLCKDSLEFLGIGAGKLIDCRTDLEAAIRRCQRQDRPVKFLLCSPDNPELDEMARRAGRGAAEYQEVVRRSLVVLATLRLYHALNVEVRLYRELPLFRLMFIDDTLCLASHYVFSEGDGSQLPQIHVRRHVGQGRDVESLYYAFRLYFGKLWDQAVECDYSAFVS